MTGKAVRLAVDSGIAALAPEEEVRESSSGPKVACGSWHLGSWGRAQVRPSGLAKRSHRRRAVGLP